MDCPYCQPEEQSGSRVIDTRPQPGSSSLRRRRECKGPKGHRFTTLEALIEPDFPDKGMAPSRKRMPREHEAIGHRFSIAGHEGHIVAGKYEDGEVGEVSVGEASTFSPAMQGMLVAFGTAVSIALQYGVPLEVLVKSFVGLRFEPEGITGNPEIPFAKSIPDYTMRWLASRFIEDADILDELGIMTAEIRSRREAQLGLSPVRSRS
jgi:hypothetical protein